MSDDAHKALDNLSQTVEYQARFRYRDAPRPSESLDDISIGQLGHMLDTLKDGVLFMRHIAIEPKLDVTSDHVYKYLDQSDLPPFLERFASNPLVAPTFMRTDTGRIQQSKIHPDLSAFMNSLHGLMRKQSLEIGKTFIIPDEAKDIAEQYDALIERYVGFLDKYKNPTNGKRDYTQIPPAEMKAFAAEFEPLADKLGATLKAQPEIEVEIAGRRYRLPNKGPMNDRLPDTYPASVLFSFRTLGKGAADHNKRPATLEYEKRQRKLIGAQSMITDTTQALIDLANAQGFTFEGSDIDRSKLKEFVKDYTRSFQLALAFCRAADCGYEMMYQDMERFIRMGDGETSLRTLEIPQEMALMLYAVERRFAREEKDPALQQKLHSYTDKIANCADMQTIVATLGQDIEFQRTLMRSHQIIEDNKMGIDVSDALDKIQAVTRHAQGTAPQIAARRASSEMPATGL
jgi:hypothetical protein